MVGHTYKKWIMNSSHSNEKYAMNMGTFPELCPKSPQKQHEDHPEEEVGWHPAKNKSNMGRNVVPKGTLPAKSGNPPPPSHASVPSSSRRPTSPSQAPSQSTNQFQALDGIPPKPDFLTILKTLVDRSLINMNPSFIIRGQGIRIGGGGSKKRRW
jgi:hypothetical protein